MAIFLQSSVAFATVYRNAHKKWTFYGCRGTWVEHNGNANTFTRPGLVSHPASDLAGHRPCLLQQSRTPHPASDAFAMFPE
ncbi:hypothetical protein [Alcanivorax sp. MD8A]|uniref:hypothetical protein n=1 Tax=Alcanivorax sp. MD8A TaxID=1177157 RepID=UPI0011AF560A|nr:hypothetical protein [Alcanivorax sp. MD8A]